MPTILFTYELGAGLGHLNRLIEAARRLTAGNRLVFAVPHPTRHAPIIRRALGNAIEVRQGAWWPGPTDPQARNVETRTLADVLRLFGFDIVDKLLAAVSGAAGLLNEIGPRLIVADFAPTMRLASVRRIPTVVVGNGYTVPPPGRPLPPVRPWEREVNPTSRAHEAMLLAAANHVSARVSGPATDFLADLLHGETSFYCTLAEFDPYRMLRANLPQWPFNIPRMPPARDFADRRGPAVFCYFQITHPALPVVLRVLGDIGCATEMYVEGVDAQHFAQRCPRNVGIHRAPADFARVLPETSLLVHHAGLGSAYAGLAAGVPQMVLPVQLEHLITTRGLEQFGAAAGFGVTPLPQAAKLESGMRDLLAGSQRQQAALRAAAEVERRRDDASPDRIAAACAAYL